MRIIPTNLLVGQRLVMGVVAVLWAGAVAVPALMVQANAVKAARKDAEERLLARFAATLRTSSTSTDEVLVALERQQRELADVRYVRVCNRLGMPMDWSSLLETLRHCSKSQQASAARIIAQECHLTPGTTLEGEQIRLTTRLVQTRDTKMTAIPLRMQRSVD